MTVETVAIGGRTVRFTNPDKVLWPATGTTKRDLLEYYRAVAPVLLDHIAGRPMTLGRWPDGTGELGWFQTNCPHPPGWIPTHPVRRRNYCLINEEPALVWAVNLATIEFHPLLARVPALDAPDSVLFDLDPGEDVPMGVCATVDLLASFWLQSMNTLPCRRAFSMRSTTRPGRAAERWPAVARAKRFVAA